LEDEKTERSRGRLLGRKGSKIERKTRPETTRWKTCNTSLQPEVDAVGVRTPPESARTTPVWVWEEREYDVSGELKKEKKEKTARRYCFC
jgi:hypothetical protein